jgi:hypothetical protein
MATVKGLEKVLRRYARLAPTQKSAVAKQLKAEVDDLVAAQKRAAPVDPNSDNPGKLRDRPLSYRILADAKDEDGKFIGSNIEAGHRARDGSHVPARPSFFPTYRARKKGMRRRLMAASRAALKQL